jgi:Ca2+-binding RTX toxin-like protein
VALLAPVALAAIQCRYNPCFGTDQLDRLLERNGEGLNDTIYGKDRGDLLDAENFIRDHDELLGQRGADTLRAQDQDGADVLKGGKGFDTCFADSGDVVYSCEDLDQPPPES